MSLTKTLLQKFQDQLKNIKLSTKRAQEWFAKKLKNLNGNIILSSDKTRLIGKESLNSKLTGRMVMYFYDPKLKDKLPYYDRFPLAIIIRSNKNGFLALNLHYLPINLRAKLLNGLFSIYKTKHLDENKKLNLSYQMLKQSSRTKYFSPCIKKYLFSHIRSKFYVVDPEEWEMVLTLPTERFVKHTKEYVWEQSKKQLGVSNK